MDLELIIFESIGGFCAGFALSALRDRREFDEEWAIERAKIDSERDTDKLEDARIKEELQEEAKRAYLKRGAGISAFFGAIIGGLNALCDHEVLAPGIAAAISTYLGIQAGRYINRMSRSRARLSQKEKETLEKCLQDLRHSRAPGSNESYGDIATRYVGRLINRKKNLQVAREIYQRYNEAESYAARYRVFQQFLAGELDKEKDKENFINSKPAVVINNETIILIPHRERVYQIRFKLVQNESSGAEEGGLCMLRSDVPEEYEWDGTVDGLIGIMETAEKKYPNNNLLVARERPGQELQMRIDRVGEKYISNCSKACVKMQRMSAIERMIHQSRN